MILPGIDKSWNPKELVQRVLELKYQKMNDRHYGPFILVLAREWINYLDEPYSTLLAGAQRITMLSLRDRLWQIQGIIEVTIDASAPSWTVFLKDS